MFLKPNRILLNTQLSFKRTFFTINVSRPKERMALIELNRPDQYNVITMEMLDDLTEATRELDHDSKVGAIVISGLGKAFAAGVDITSFNKSYEDVVRLNFLRKFRQLESVRKPMIAAVNGFALGGGLELAMMCDIIYASEVAKFGQPEIKLGLMPGCGGTQRLTRLVGRSKAMEMILTGEMIDAGEALQFNLVSKVLPIKDLLPHAIEKAHWIGKFGTISVISAKQAVNQAEEVGVKAGLEYEETLFRGLFATRDKDRGTRNFLRKEKHMPDFSKF